VFLGECGLFGVFFPGSIPPPGRAQHPTWTI